MSLWFMVHTKTLLDGICVRNALTSSALLMWIFNPSFFTLLVRIWSKMLAVAHVDLRSACN